MRSLGHLSRSLLLLCLVQCGTPPEPEAEDTGKSCRTVCKEQCSAFAACGFETQPDCADECENALRHIDCRGERPADQFTCEELELYHACATYCGAFCARAPECGSFDGQRCLEGCSYGQPPVCNAASVAARTCDQLKPEARLYDDLGDSLQRESDFAYFSSPDAYLAYGLCREARDCTAPLTCSLATNTCE
jgi:hypothetical protein